MDMHER